MSSSKLHMLRNLRDYLQVLPALGSEGYGSDVNAHQLLSGVCIAWQNLILRNSTSLTGDLGSLLVLQDRGPLLSFLKMPFCPLLELNFHTVKAFLYNILHLAD